LTKPGPKYNTCMRKRYELKEHVRLHNSNYYLCGLPAKGEMARSNTLASRPCLNCNNIAFNLFVPTDQNKEIKDAVEELRKKPLPTF
jgi:hypothetical protein